MPACRGFSQASNGLIIEARKNENRWFLRFRASLSVGLNRMAALGEPRQALPKSQYCFIWAAAVRLRGGVLEWAVT